MEDVKERQEFFIGLGGQEDNDELLDELDELEAEMAADDLDVEVGAGAVKHDKIGAEGQVEAPQKAK